MACWCDQTQAEFLGGVSACAAANKKWGGGGGYCEFSAGYVHDESFGVGGCRWGESYFKKAREKTGKMDNTTSATQQITKKGIVTMNIFPGLAPVMADATKKLSPTGGVIKPSTRSVSYTHLRAHETVLDLVCRLLLEKKKNKKEKRTK